jgi:hypothetical protein
MTAGIAGAYADDPIYTLKVRTLFVKSAGWGSWMVTGPDEDTDQISPHTSDLVPEVQLCGFAGSSRRFQ